MQRGALWLAAAMAGALLVACGGGGNGDDGAAGRDLGSNVRNTDATPTPVAAKSTATGSFTCDRAAGAQCDLAFSKPETAQNASKQTNTITVDFNPNGGELTGKLVAELTLTDGSCELKAEADLTGKFDSVTRFFNGAGTLTTTRTGACNGAAAKDGALTWTGSMSADGKSVAGQLKQENAAFPFALAVQ